MRIKHQGHRNVGRFLLFLFVSSFVMNVYFLVLNYRRSVVVSVPDGDSIQLLDGRRIRLLGLDAPERGRCGADEARDALIIIANGRHVRLKNTVTDDYGRTLANVIIEDFSAWIGYMTGKIDPYVNRVMVSRGLAKYSSQSTEYRETLRAASLSAKNQALGIYSPGCRSTDPTTDCVIKGNIRASQKTYHLPECKNYDQTIVDESFGDRWFCTEADAVAAGYRKASGCK